MDSADVKFSDRNSHSSSLGFPSSTTCTPGWGDVPAAAATIGNVSGSRLRAQPGPGVICSRYRPTTGPGVGVGVGVGEALGPLGPEPQAAARRLTTMGTGDGRRREMPRKHGMIQ